MVYYLCILILGLPLGKSLIKKKNETPGYV